MIWFAHFVIQESSRITIALIVDENEQLLFDRKIKQQNDDGSQAHCSDREEIVMIKAGRDIP